MRVEAGFVRNPIKFSGTDMVVPRRRRLTSRLDETPNTNTNNREGARSTAKRTGWAQRESNRRKTRRVSLALAPSPWRCERTSPALGLPAAAQCFHRNVSKLRTCAAKRNVRPRGAPQYGRRGVVVEGDVCIAGADTARLAPGGTTPHSIRRCKSRFTER